MNSKYINNEDKKIINGLSQNVFQKNKQQKQFDKYIFY